MALIGPSFRCYMNYQLALKLKKAGFPQLENGNGFYYERGVTILEEGAAVLGMEILTGSFAKKAEEKCYAPTLEELREYLPKKIQGGMFPEEAFAYAYIAERVV